MKLTNADLVSTRKIEVQVFTIWFNRSKFISTSIGSLINQTSNEFEIIAVDDGSTDETWYKLQEMLDKATEADVPMTIWKKENQGFTVSIKRAIDELGSSPVIALHGAGDVSLPDRIKLQMQLLRQHHDTIAVGCAVAKMDDDGSVFGEMGIPAQLLSNDDVEANKVPRLGTHGSAMFLRSAYNEAGGYREHFRYSQDADLLLRLIYQGNFRNITTVHYKKLYGSLTVAGRSDYRKNLDQAICGAAARISWEKRLKGEEDPIDQLSPYDWDGLVSLAKSNGQIFYSRISDLAFQLIRNNRFSEAYRVCKILDEKKWAVYIRALWKKISGLKKVKKMKNV